MGTAALCASVRLLRIQRAVGAIKTRQFPCFSWILVSVLLQVLSGSGGEGPAGDGQQAPHQGVGQADLTQQVPRQPGVIPHCPAKPEVQHATGQELHSSDEPRPQQRPLPEGLFRLNTPNAQEAKSSDRHHAGVAPAPPGKLNTVVAQAAGESQDYLPAHFSEMPLHPSHPSFPAAPGNGPCRAPGSGALWAILLYINRKPVSRR